MKPHEGTDCVDLLLDLVFYERFRRHLSPEMEYLFQGHLETCPGCRTRILDFRRILDGQIHQRNYG
jgi:hypothetical protein